MDLVLLVALGSLPLIWIAQVLPKLAVVSIAAVVARWRGWNVVAVAYVAGATLGLALAWACATDAGAREYNELAIGLSYRAYRAIRIPTADGYPVPPWYVHQPRLFVAVLGFVSTALWAGMGALVGLALRPGGGLRALRTRLAAVGESTAGAIGLGLSIALILAYVGVSSALPLAGYCECTRHRGTHLRITGIGGSACVGRDGDYFAAEQPFLTKAYAGIGAGAELWRTHGFAMVRDEALECLVTGVSQFGRPSGADDERRRGMRIADTTYGAGAGMTVVHLPLVGCQ